LIQTPCNIDLVLFEVATSEQSQKFTASFGEIFLEGVGNLDPKRIIKADTVVIKQANRSYKRSDWLREEGEPKHAAGCQILWCAKQTLTRGEGVDLYRRKYIEVSTLFVAPGALRG
jgi:hypothetical protein